MSHNANSLPSRNIATTDWVKLFINSDQIINGQKTLTSDLVVQGTNPDVFCKFTNIERGVIPSAASVGSLSFLDKNNRLIGQYAVISNIDGINSTRLVAWNQGSTDDNERADLGVAYTNTGVKFGFAPTPPVGASDSSIATTEWVNNVLIPVLNTANNAVGTANAASTTANNAVNTANAASTTANSALTKVNGINTNFNMRPNWAGRKTRAFNTSYTESANGYIFGRLQATSDTSCITLTIGGVSLQVRARENWGAMTDFFCFPVGNGVVWKASAGTVDGRGVGNDNTGSFYALFIPAS